MMIETGRKANPPKTIIKKFGSSRRCCPFTTPPWPHARKSRSVHR